FFHLGRALVRLYDGRWDDAIAEVQASQQIQDRLGLSQGVHGIAALIGVHRSDHRLLEDLAQQPTPTIGGDYFEFLRGWATTLIREGHGAQRKALELLIELWEGCLLIIQPARYLLS